MTSRRTDTPALLLSGLRGVGGAAFLLPSAGAKAFGIEAGPEENYLVRLFAARNIALTAGLLLSDGSTRRRWYQVGIACDLLDTLAGLSGLREGKKRSSVAIDVGASATAALIGLAGLLAGRPGRGAAERAE